MKNTSNKTLGLLIAVGGLMAVAVFMMGQRNHGAPVNPVQVIILAVLVITLLVNIRTRETLTEDQMENKDAETHMNDAEDGEDSPVRQRSGADSRNGGPEEDSDQQENDGLGASDQDVNAKAEDQASKPASGSSQSDESQSPSTDGSEAPLDTLEALQETIDAVMGPDVVTAAESSRTRLTSAQQLERLILDAEHPIRLIKDMLDHEDRLENQRQRYLCWLLHGVAVDSIIDTPINIGQLLESDNSYFAAHEELNLTQLEAMLGVEGALNLARRIPDEQVGQKDSWRSWTISQLKRRNVIEKRPEVNLDELTLAYGQQAEDHLKGQWATRKIIATFMEKIPTYYRLISDFNVNVDSGVAGFVFQAMPAATFKVLEDPELSKELVARDFALRTASLLAHMAFQAPVITQVRLEARTLDDRPLFYCHFDMKELQEFDEEIDKNGHDLPSAIKNAMLTSTGWFFTVTSRLNLAGKEFIDGTQRNPLSMIDQRPSAELSRLIAADSFDQVRMNAQDVLDFVWRDRVPATGISTHETVANFVKIKEEVDDYWCKQACDRAIRCLVDGVFDYSDAKAIKEEFLHGSPLNRQFQKIFEEIGALRDPHNPTNPQQFISIFSDLEAMLEKIQEEGIFADTENTVYRWFESIPARIAYNRHLKDHRQVVLVPALYYMALQSHISLCLVSGDLKRGEKSVQEILRIAPTSVDPVLLSTKYFEMDSRYLRAQEEPRDLLPITMDYKGSSFLLYRLAYLNWQMKDYQLATALYSMVLAWPHTAATEPAAEELNELFAENDDYKDADVQELKLDAAKQGYVTSCDKDGDESLMKIAVLALDQGVYRLSVGALICTIAYQNTQQDILHALQRSVIPLS